MQGGIYYLPCGDDKKKYVSLCIHHPHLTPPPSYIETPNPSLISKFVNYIIHTLDFTYNVCIKNVSLVRTTPTPSNAH